MFSFCFSCTCVCAHSPPLSCACAQFYSLKIPAWCNALRAMNACLWDGVCQMMCIRKVLKEPIESKHMLTFLNLSLGWYALEVADTLEEQSVEWICISKGWLLSSQILKATKHLLQDISQLFQSQHGEVLTLVAECGENTTGKRVVYSVRCSCLLWLQGTPEPGWKHFGPGCSSAAGWWAVFTRHWVRNCQLC